MITAVYYNSGHLKLSELFSAMQPDVDELYRRYVEIEDIVFKKEDNFWVATLYYHEKETS